MQAELYKENGDLHGRYWNFWAAVSEEAQMSERGEICGKSHIRFHDCKAWFERQGDFWFRRYASERFEHLTHGRGYYPSFPSEGLPFRALGFGAGVSLSARDGEEFTPPAHPALNLKNGRAAQPRFLIW